MMALPALPGPPPSFPLAGSRSPAVNYDGPPCPARPSSVLSPGRKQKAYAMHLRVTEDERDEDGTLTVKFELMTSVREKNWQGQSHVDRMHALIIHM